MRRLVLVALALSFLPSLVEGQSDVDMMSIGRTLPLVTRAGLLESLAWHRAFVDSVGVKKKERAKALDAIENIQARLEHGDFQPGDKIFFSVEGEVTFPDTLLVEGGPSVLLPNVGSVSVDGILRSELQDHLTRELSRFLRDPVVRALPTIRLTMGGLMGRPGFYTFPATIPIGDAIMLAGGPVGESRMGSIRVTRGGASLFRAEEVQLAIAQGLTFDQLGLRPGDEIYIPEKILTMRRVVTWGLGAGTFLLLGFRLYGGG